MVSKTHQYNSQRSRINLAKNFSRARKLAETKPLENRPEERRIARVGGKVGRYTRTLAQAEQDHQVNFMRELLELKRHFPKERLEVLVEGCGQSSVPNELRQKGITVLATDIVPRGINANAAPVSVNDLASQCGRNKFHMIISTRGGVDWGDSPEKAFANIFAVLKPKGKAFITLTYLAQTKETLQKLGIPHNLKQNRLVIYK